MKKNLFETGIIDENENEILNAILDLKNKLKEMNNDSYNYNITEYQIAELANKLNMICLCRVLDVYFKRLSESAAFMRNCDYSFKDYFGWSSEIKIFYGADIHRYLNQDYLSETSLIVLKNLSEKEIFEFYLYSYYSYENGSVVCLDGLLGTSHMVYALRHSDEVKKELAKELLDAYIIKPFKIYSEAFYLRSIPVYNRYIKLSTDMKVRKIFDFLKSFFRKHRIEMGDVQVAANGSSFYKIFELSQPNWWHDLEFF